MLDHPLARLGWRAELQPSLDALGDASLIPARVTAVDRGAAVVDSGDASWSAPLSGRLRRVALGPVTGDFVALAPDAPVRAVLPRSGVIARRRDAGGNQVLAANVDIALVATSANRDLELPRLRRFLAITARGDVRTVVLLTKVDLVEDVAAAARNLEDGLDDTTVLPLSLPSAEGLDAVRALLEPRCTAVLLGSSGVGKSTLVNALLGTERQATQPIRAADDRGRHTTVRRELVELPGGALMIDTPGLRVVAPPGEDEGDATAPPVDKAAQRRERRARERALHRAYRRNGADYDQSG